MLAKTAHDAVELADEAFNRADVEGLLAFYEDDLVFVLAPQQKVLRGKAQLKALVEETFARKPVNKWLRSQVVESGDIALWTGEWCFSYPDTKEVAKGTSSIVLRRGQDGGWRIVIESPWNTSV
jgi:ketosteroid isomerase-like protein